MSWSSPRLPSAACNEGDHELGEAVTELLSRWDGQLVQVSLVIDWGPVSLYLGKLDRLSDRLDDSVAHLEHAVRACESAGLATWQALAEAELAMSLRARRLPGDEERATQLAEQAADSAAALGLRRVEDLLEEPRPR